MYGFAISLTESWSAITISLKEYVVFAKLRWFTAISVLIPTIDL